MEVKLEIISFQKSLMGDGQSCSFDETGGSIGRSRDNAWVLPDPNRYVSSQHAEIAFVDGRFRIIDTSTNGVFVNGASTALGRDRHHDLADGDRLVLGDYEIAVRLQSRRDRPAPVAAGPAPLAGLDRTPPKDILDVVGGRRSEPRLGRLELPADVFDHEVPPPAAAPPSRPTPIPPTERARAPLPLPPSPPRPTARPRADQAEPVAAPPSASPPRPAAPPPPAIPDDADLTARGSVDSVPPPPREATPSAPARPPLLPDDLDDLLPAAPVAPRPVSEAPPPAAAAPPQSAVLPDDLDDLLPTPPSAPRVSSPAAASPAMPPAAELPEGVPLLRPMPGTGNREEPLSPAPTGEGRDTAGPPPVSLPTAPAAVAGSGGANPLIAALAEGLGLDRAVLEGLDPRTTAATAGRAVRAAANGVAEAIDARNALARVAGVDPRSLDHDDGNPFATFRSGEEAMKHALVGTSGVQSLDAATRSSVAALAVNSNAAAAGLDAVLARFSTDPPPRSAAEVREIFGTAFLNAYHRETDRLK